MARQHWLMKSEPETFGIDDLERKGSEHWDGVRNYQARNFMRDEMQIGDPVLFYHSNANPPGVAGIARVSSESYADHTASDPDSPYYDPKSTQNEPAWYMVDVEFVEKFPAVVPLDVLKETAGLEEMMVIKKGMRLSIQPVTASEFKIVRSMGRKAEAATSGRKNRG